MRKEILKHYISQVRRGTITKDTTIIDFLEKMQEEDNEMVQAAKECVDKSMLTPEFIHETIDSIAVRVNMLTHLNVDMVAEFKKNREYQEDRIC